MIINLSYLNKRSAVGNLVLDVLVSEELDLEAGVTKYPVEDGTVISDHIMQGTKRLRISGLVAASDAMAFSFSALGRTRMSDAMEELERMHSDRALVAISTGLKRYEDYGIVSLKAARSNDPKKSGFLDISMELMKVKKVQLREADVPAERASSPTSRRAGQTAAPTGTSANSNNSSPTTGTGGTQDRVVSWGKRIQQEGGVDYLRQGVSGLIGR